MTAERDRLKTHLERVEVEGAVLKEGAARKVRSSAVPDLLARAKNVFRLVDGEPRALEADGKTVRVGRDGVTSLTVAEWVEGQVADAPHLFEGNAGGGVAGAGSGGAGGQRNLWRKGAEWNNVGAWQTPRLGQTHHMPNLVPRRRIGLPPTGGENAGMWAGLTV